MPIKFVDRLANLEISRVDFDCYWDTFVKGPTRYWLKKNSDSDWFFKQKKDGSVIPLNIYVIARHLQGEFWVAKQMPGKTDYFCIDLDKDEEDSIKDRYSRITSILPNPIVIQSSAGGGLHLYYFLKEETWVNNIADALRDLLGRAGIRIKPGQIEIFPGSIDHLRLPFGRDSVLMDPISLDTIGLTLKESIQWVRSHPRPDIKDIDETTRRGAKKIDTVRFSSYPVPESISVDVPAVLDSGITEYGTRHETLKRLVRFYLIDCGLSNYKIEKRINSWLESFSHKSKDWEKNPDRVKRELRAIIKNLRSKYKKRLFTDKISLTTGDVDFIMKATLCISDSTYYSYSRDAYYTQLFIFDLLSFFKEKKSKLLDLPYNTVKKFHGASDRTAAERISFCESVNLTQLVKSHDRNKHTSRKYKLNYEFRDGKEVKTLEEGILMLYTKTELYRLFSKRIFKRILEAVP